MATMNISLPDSLKGYAKERSLNGSYSNPSDYVRSLIREDKERSETQAQLEVLLHEGLSSGSSIPVNGSYWKEKRARLTKQLNVK